MKRYLFVGFLALVFLMTGFQTAFSQTGAGSDRGNAAPFKALPQELQELDVKDYFIDSGALPAGTVQRVIGHVVVLHAGTKEAFFAAVGDAVCKSDILFTLRDSRCRIAFSTDDVLTMGEDSRIEIEEHIDDRKQKKKTSVFNMLRGKVMFYAVRLFKYRTSAMSVKTPTAVAGVRGTKFGVAVDDAADEVTVHCYRGPVDAMPTAGGAGQKAAVDTDRYLADASGSDFRYLLAQFGDPLDKGPVTLYDGESWTQKKGVHSDPDGQANHERDTSVGGPDLTGEGGAVDDTGLPPFLGDPDKRNLTELIAGWQPGYMGPRIGYFTCMLAEYYEDIYGTHWWFDNAYASSSPQDFDSPPSAADGFITDSPPPVVEVNWAAATPYVEKVITSYYDTAVLGPNWPITREEIGHDTYGEWGWWSAPNPFSIGSCEYKLIQGTYFDGDIEPDSAVRGISGIFEGDAWGVHYDPNSPMTDGVRMMGNFSCEVDGAAGTVNNFNLRVDAIDGGPQFAEIGYGAGSFGSNRFTIQSADYWSLYGAKYGVFYGGGVGSLYKGNKISGTWGMVGAGYSGYVGAAGSFKGDKTGPLP